MEKALFTLPEKKKYKDIYLDNLLNAINADRIGTKYKPITYARLQSMLQKLGKSKKNWSRDVFIGSVLDRPNPSKYFWWVMKMDKKV